MDSGDRYGGLLEAAALPARVSSLTHSFYRYPARFGERFVREAIASFSRRGDLVLDPFCGGGTTVVEALAAGRRAVGCDINRLGLFVASAKTTLLSEVQLKRISSWLREVTQEVAPLLAQSRDATAALLVGVPPHYRNLFGNLCSSLERLPRGECQQFARVLILRTAQWALDGKESVPTPTQFLTRLRHSFDVMTVGLRAFRVEVENQGHSKADVRSRRKLLSCRAADIAGQPFFGGKLNTAGLVITSPPYLGVHVLYNKWQVGGRTETRAPYFISAVPDLGAPSRYTLLSRGNGATKKYFDAIHESFAAVYRRLSEKGHVIQLVSFADSERSLPPYLDALTAAGLELCDMYVSSAGGLTWRPVPGRRWYARVGAISDSSAANEVLLIHRRRR